MARKNAQSVMEPALGRGRRRKTAFAVSQSEMDLSLPAVIASRIGEKILKWEIPPGTRIIETRLSKELQVGQPSVREALILLERQGLVRRVAHLGTFVPDLAIREIRELYQIRGQLEGFAAQEAANRMRETDFARLRHLVDDLRIAASAGRWRFFQADLTFHRELWTLSGNEQLAAILENVVIRLMGFTYKRIERSPEQLAAAVQTHYEIIDALASGPQNARKALESHMGLYLKPYLDQFLL